VNRFLKCADSVKDPKKLTTHSFLQPTKFVCVANRAKTKHGAPSDRPVSIFVYKGGKKREVQLPQIEDAPEAFIDGENVQVRAVLT
jgi:hypothetical protein